MIKITDEQVIQTMCETRGNVYLAAKKLQVSVRAIYYHLGDKRQSIQDAFYQVEKIACVKCCGAGCSRCNGNGWVSPWGYF